MKTSKTNRGFSLVEFKDRNGRECRLQKSSLATEDAIWFGVVDPSPEIMVSDAKRLGLPFDKESGWCAFDVPKEVLIHVDMHLTQEQVRELLPHLIKFSETGEF